MSDTHEDTYSIIRFYILESKKKDRVIKSGLTLSEAIEHCSKEETHGKDFFDGYTKEQK